MNFFFCIVLVFSDSAVGVHRGIVNCCFSICLQGQGNALVEWLAPILCLLINIHKVINIPVSYVSMCIYVLHCVCV